MVHQSILGTADFVDWVRQKLPRQGQREIPSLTKLQQELSVERIIDEVAKAGNAQADELCDRKTKLKDLRQMAMELSYRWSTCKQTDIGMIFGVDYSTVSQSRTRLRAKLKSNRKLKKQFDRIQIQINNLSKSLIWPYCLNPIVYCPFIWERTECAKYNDENDKWCNEFGQLPRDCK